MSKFIILVLLSVLTPLAHAHNAPFPHADMHHELAHVLVHALFALPMFIAAWVGFNVWQHFKRNAD